MNIPTLFFFLSMLLQAYNIFADILIDLFYSFYTLYLQFEWFQIKLLFWLFFRDSDIWILIEVLKPEPLLNSSIFTKVFLPLKIFKNKSKTEKNNTWYVIFITSVQIIKKLLALELFLLISHSLPLLFTGLAVTQCKLQNFILRPLLNLGIELIKFDYWSLDPWTVFFYVYFSLSALCLIYIIWFIIYNWTKIWIYLQNYYRAWLSYLYDCLSSNPSELFVIFFNPAFFFFSSGMACGCLSESGISSVPDHGDSRVEVSLNFGERTVIQNIHTDWDPHFSFSRSCDEDLRFKVVPPYECARIEVQVDVQVEVNTTRSNS